MKFRREKNQTQNLAFPSTGLLRPQRPRKALARFLLLFFDSAIVIEPFDVSSLIDIFFFSPAFNSRTLMNLLRYTKKCTENNEVLNNVELKIIAKKQVMGKSRTRERY